jgi:hypothetical protein
MLSNPDDPHNQVPQIRERKADKEAVFPGSPLAKVHEDTDRRKAALKKETGLELGLSSNTLFQGLTTALPGEDKTAVATTLDFVGTWEAINRDEPNRGQVLSQVEGR